ncbi:MAG TPA: sugar transferase [Candidatus Acidoferrum sp.]|jgi:exopolysaccharide biosynthesis polyprenyl glycosylphosphotransferase|nr:sugar transferase [Candidatus Acidoferrum sp.]
MLGERSIGIRTLSLISLLVLVALSFWGWLFVWEPGLLFDRTALERYVLYNEFLLIGILFGLGGKRHAEGPHQGLTLAVRRSTRQAVLGLFCVFFIVFALQDTGISRSFFLSYIPALYVTLLFSNLLVPRALGKWAFSGDREERVALAGTLEQASQFKPWLERKRVLGLRTVGVVCPQLATGNGNGKGNGANGNGSPFPVLGPLDQMGEILKKSAITQLIVLDLSLGSDRLRKLTQLCENAAVRLVALHDLNNYFNHTTTTFEDDGVRFIGLREEPLESPFNRFVKRVLDLVISVPVVVLILPFTSLLVWVLQRRQSPGPVFYKQTRVGLMGHTFQMFKYRTMRTNHGSDSQQAAKEDPRVYPAGRWLRKFSLDELPQFLNVLKGEMSVVGPRPHLETHEELWVRVMRKYMIRRFIRPGITGWAQVSGFRGEIHSEEDIQRRVEADIYYLESWSLSFDCLIILRTILQFAVPPRNAY